MKPPKLPNSKILKCGGGQYLLPLIFSMCLGGLSEVALSMDQCGVFRGL